MDINCEVLLQEFNKHLLFIYNNAIESYCIFIMNNVVINVIRVLAILFITVSWSSSFMSSALIQSLSSSSWFLFKLKRGYCFIISCDSLVNNPFSKAHWIYGLCLLRSPLIPSYWKDNGPIGSVTSCDSCWGAMVSITFLQLTSLLFALAFFGFLLFCFGFLFFLLAWNTAP